MISSIEKLMAEARVKNNYPEPGLKWSNTIGGLVEASVRTQEEKENSLMRTFAEKFLLQYTDQELEAMALEMWPVVMHKHGGDMSYDINDISRRIGLLAFQHLRDRMIKDLTGK